MNKLGPGNGLSVTSQPRALGQQQNPSELDLVPELPGTASQAFPVGWVERGARWNKVHEHGREAERSSSKMRAEAISPQPDLERESTVSSEMN